MEESLNKGSILSKLYGESGGAGVDIRAYSPLTLAYIGDAVFELVIRTLAVGKGQRASDTLHRYTTGIVCAQTQAKMIDAVYGSLTREEQEIYRRGKNTKTSSSAKNASLSEYHKATGFEALCGYLFLRDDTDRLLAVIRQALEAVQADGKTGKGFI